MKTITTAKLIPSILQSLRSKKQRIGFVPTMGSLHEGHAKLIKLARKQNDYVIVSIFVNPTQFSPNEDYLKYPKSLSADKALCDNLGCDLLYAPSAKSIFSSQEWVVKKNSFGRGVMCDRFRKGHFDGVVSVVSYFFKIFSPDKAYFGQKDFQQLAIISNMAKCEFKNKPRIVAVSTAREKNGLAMSSRNAYLSLADQKVAPILYRTLKIAKQQYYDNCMMADIVSNAKNTLNEFGFEVQYCEFVDNTTLKKVTSNPECGVGLRLAVAAFLSDTRLIDNILI